MAWRAREIFYVVIVGDRSMTKEACSSEFCQKKMQSAAATEKKATRAHFQEQEKKRRAAVAENIIKRVRERRN